VCKPLRNSSAAGRGKYSLGSRASHAKPLPPISPKDPTYSTTSLLGKPYLWLNDNESEHPAKALSTEGNPELEPYGELDKGSDTIEVSTTLLFENCVLCRARRMQLK